MGSMGHSQAESHTGLKWAHVYIGPLTGRKSLGPNIRRTINRPDLASGRKWAQIFGEQLTGQIWLRAVNGPLLSRPLLGWPIMDRKILWALSWAGPFKLYGPLLGRATCRRIIGALGPMSG